MAPTSDRRLLLVHAHPDDETINNGVTMARCVDEGAQVTLVTCTAGEEGEVLVPGLEHLAADRHDTLGVHRREELAAAMAALGVTDYRYLGGFGRYRDSGMMGTPANERPDAFWRADLREAADLLVPVVRELRPRVLITYDEFGGYGHPDHIQAHRVATYAAALAAVPSYKTDLGPAWEIGKVYWNAVPRSSLQASIDAMKETGGTFFDVDSADDLPFAVPDELIDAVVDGIGWVERKMAAMRAHATQIQVDGPFFALSNNVGSQVWGIEHYRLAKGSAGTRDPDTGWETDLFEGVA